MVRVNYDRIAHLYDEPLRDHSVDAHLVRFLEEQPWRRTQPLRLLDLGCGTGKQLAANHAAFPDSIVVGLDRFRGMLGIARARCPGAQWVQGDAARIPFKSESFAYVTSQFSYHHLEDPAALIREAFRVLSPGGRFVMLNIDPWEMPQWIVYQCFPQARERDERDFVPAQAFADRMRAVGFSSVEVSHQRRQTQESCAAFLAYARQRHRTSQLLALPDDEYEAGIRHLERRVNEAGEAAATLESVTALVTIRGEKPEARSINRRAPKHQG